MLVNVDQLPRSAPGQGQAFCPTSGGLRQTLTLRRRKCELTNICGDLCVSGRQTRAEQVDAKPTQFY